MKYITFIRHAKSSWESFAIPDHDRPLNPRGKRDVDFMGDKLKELNFNPQLIVSSSAKRARKTAKSIANKLTKNEILIEDKLYEANPTIIMQVISKLNNNLNDIFIVAHNPTLTEIINYFSVEPIYNVPTTGVFKVKFDVANWNEVSFESGELVEFIYPKMYKNEY